MASNKPCNCEGRNVEYSERSGQKQDRISQSWNVFLGDEAQLYLRGEGEQPNLATRSFAIRLENHQILASFEPENGLQEWSLDGHRLQLTNGIDLLKHRDQYDAVATHMEDSELTAELVELVERFPFPALLSPMARVGNILNLELLKSVEEVVDRAIESRRYIAFSSSSADFGDTDPFGPGCYEQGGYCPPEHGRCVDCSESTGVFDWFDPPWGGGGSGDGDDDDDDNGNGGFDDWYEKWCQEQYLKGLRRCNAELKACRDLGRFNSERMLHKAALGSADREDSEIDETSRENLEILQKASQFDHCGTQFDICLDNLMWRFQFCMGGGGWPEIP